MVYMANELIGRRLQKIRITAKLELHDMAKMLGVSEGHYRKIERGIYSLDIPKLMTLYEKLDVDPLYLLTGRREAKVSGRQQGRVSTKEQVCELLDYCRKKISEGEGVF